MSETPDRFNRRNRTGPVSLKVQRFSIKDGNFTRYLMPNDPGDRCTVG